MSVEIKSLIAEDGREESHKHSDVRERRKARYERETVEQRETAFSCRQKHYADVNLAETRAEAKREKCKGRESKRE